MHLPMPDASTLYKILAHAPGIVCLLGPDLAVRYVNKLAPLDSELAVDHLLGRDDANPEQAAHVRRMYELARDTRQQQQIEYTADSPHGERRWHVVRVAALWNGADEHTGWVTIATDATSKKQAEMDLEQVQADLLEASHRAGMAEVATGVLHNIGNVLNSINISASVLMEQAGTQHIDVLSRVVQLCEDAGPDLPAFLTSDPRGHKVPELLGRISQQLEAEREMLRAELVRLIEHIDILRSMVDAQQSIARSGKLLEHVHPRELLDRALSIVRIDLDSAAVEVSVDIQAPQPVQLDKQATLQILVNLMRNAIEALQQGKGERSLTIRVAAEAERVRFEVIDTGCGIPGENMGKIFRHGFTTKQRGHGFGLHASAIAARAMGGSLTAESDGPDRGARFCLSLPRQLDAGGGHAPAARQE